MEDRQPGFARDVTQDLRQLHIHLHQGFLHVLNMRGTMFQETSAMAQIGAQGHDFLIGSKRRTERAIGVQALQPLAILLVSLTPRDIGKASNVGSVSRFMGQSPTPGSLDAIRPGQDSTKKRKLLNGVMEQPKSMPPLFISRLPRTILENGLKHAPVRNSVIACLIASASIISQMQDQLPCIPHKFLSLNMPAKA